MGIIVTGTPKIVRGDEGETELGKRMGERVAISVAFDTKRMYTSALCSFVKL